MHEIPTPAWITSRQLAGPTYLVTRVPGWQAALFAGVPFALLAILGLVTGRQDLFFGLLAVGAPVTAAIGYGSSRFRFLAAETWLAAEYLTHRRLVRLDEVVKASVTSGSYTYLTLRDSRGGSVAIQMTATYPHIRKQVIRAIMEGLPRGLTIDERTASSLGIKIVVRHREP